MYLVVVRRWFNTPKDYIILSGPHQFLSDAIQERKLSGDLIVDAKTFKVEKSIEWLWLWELSKPNCYARKAMAFDNEIQ